MTTIPVTDLTFEQEVANSSLPVLVYFWADWCGPCKTVAPVLEQLSEEMHNQVKFVKIDAGANPDITNHVGVRGLPSMFVFNNAQIVSNRSGSASKHELKSWIRDSI